MSRSSPVGPNGGIDFLRFSSMLKPEIKLKRVQDIFKNILALGFMKFNGKNRKIQFFGTTLKYKLATLLLLFISLVILIFASNFQ